VQSSLNNSNTTPSIKLKTGNPLVDSYLSWTHEHEIVSRIKEQLHAKQVQIVKLAIDIEKIKKLMTHHSQVIHI
jgi:hypothetical protein